MLRLKNPEQPMKMNKLVALTDVLTNTMSISNISNRFEMKKAWK